MGNEVVENRINLNACSYAEQTAAGTNNVVVAGTNTKGILIKIAGARGYDAASSAEVRAGAQAILSARAGANGTSSQILTNIFMPPGLALDLVVTLANAKAWVWYEVIA